MCLLELSCVAAGVVLLEILTGMQAMMPGGMTLLSHCEEIFDEIQVHDALYQQHPLQLDCTALTAHTHSPYSTPAHPLRLTSTFPAIAHGESNSTPYVCLQDTYGLELDSPGGMQEGQPSANPYLMAATLLIDRTGQWHLPAAAVVLKLGLQCCAKRRKHRPRQVTLTRS